MGNSSLTAQAVDDLDASIVRRQEASVIYGELVETELVFDPHPYAQLYLAAARAFLGLGKF